MAHAVPLAASLDQSLGTMVRFFLLALALVAPVAWWQLRGRRPATADRGAAEGAPAPAPRDRDLAWLVGEIDRIARTPSHDVTSLAVPGELATRVWGSDGAPPDPVAGALVADALRRGGVSARVVSPSRTAGDTAVEISIRQGPGR